jgi:hypothetical protein
MSKDLIILICFSMMLIVMGIGMAVMLAAVSSLL